MATDAEKRAAIAGISIPGRGSTPGETSDEEGRITIAGNYPGAAAPAGPANNSDVMVTCIRRRR